MADLFEDGLIIICRDGRRSCTVDSTLVGQEELNKICIYLYISVQESRQADHPAKSTSHQYISTTLLLWCCSFSNEMRVIIVGN